MKTNDIKKAVCYLRYSPGPDQDENSIIGQRKVINEFAEREGYIIVDEYIDRAATGTKADRTNFLRMIADSERGLFQFVIVYQLDRFSRNRTDRSIYRGILNKNGVKLISAKENISDNSSGIILQGVLETLAEYYSVELSEKIKRGYSTKAAQCLYLGGTVPLGYFIDEHKHFQIDSATAGYVQNIFEMYADGKTIREINDYLNQQNISSNRGNSFTKNSLSKLFRNKRYTGVYTFKDIEVPNGIPRIISDELYERVQQRMGEKKKASSKGKAVEEYILTPKLLCGHCKARINEDVLMSGESGTSKTGKLHTYYKCYSSRKKKCDKKVVKKKYIEDLVVDLARKQLTDENLEIIITEVEKIYKSEQDNSNLKRLKKQLRDCETATENLLKALEQGQAVDIITDRLVKKQVESQEIKKLIAKEELIYTDFDINKVRFFLFKFKTGDINDIKYRKALINLFIEKIYLFDNKMTLIFRIDKKPLDITIDLLEEIGVCEGSTVDNQPALLIKQGFWSF